MDVLLGLIVVGLIILLCVGFGKAVEQGVLGLFGRQDEGRCGDKDDAEDR